MSFEVREPKFTILSPKHKVFTMLTRVLINTNIMEQMTTRRADL